MTGRTRRVDSSFPPGRPSRRQLVPLLICGMLPLHSQREAEMTRIVVVLLSLLCLASKPSHAQVWPNKPVRIVAPFAPGGAADTLGRIVADPLSSIFKQQFFVENRPGAGGMIGAAAV